ncbi:hypothetical protein AYO44_08905 [Planctomycetaceae bacterium SCGC AG-212-F19]|nr:hypothetical protein AYO44_08905 [Planctomycetaceae bacterium SCGC AG-212-F19]
MAKANQADFGMHLIERAISILNLVGPNDAKMQQVRDQLKQAGSQLDGWVIHKRAEVEQVSGQSNDNWYRSGFRPAA